MASARSAPGSRLLFARDDRMLRSGVHARARRGELVRVRPGVYAPSDFWARLRPHERYDERVAAAARVFGSVALARESACARHRLPVFGEPRLVHFFDPDARATRTFGDVVIHASHVERPVVRLDGILVTDVAATVLDVARVLPPAYGLAVVDAAISTRRPWRLPLEVLRARFFADVNRRGTVAVSWMLEFADALAESVGESVSRACVFWCGFEDPVLQQVFTGEGPVDRSDFWWPGVRAIAEFDGYEKYAGDTKAATIAAMIAEKKREDRLRRQSDSFHRWDWADAHRVDPVQRRLIAARVPRVRPAQPAMLATLRGPMQREPHYSA